jgi:hypothetical protein
MFFLRTTVHQLAKGTWLKELHPASPKGRGFWGSSTAAEHWPGHSWAS